MRMPLKLNRAYWPTVLGKLLPSADDPRILHSNQLDEISFSKAVSTFKFGATFKSTKKARFPLTIQELVSLHYPSDAIILDVGASDGITSLDVMRSITFQKYYITDLNIDVFYDTYDKWTYFYDENKECILITSNGWIVYPDIKNAIFPFGKLAQSLFLHAPQAKKDLPRISLINPSLQSMTQKNIFVEKYNILERWPHEKVDLLIAANILNRSYFSEKQILQALENIVAALNNNSRVAIIDNRDAEKSTIFLFADGNITVEKTINGGTEIEELILRTFPLQV